MSGACPRQQLLARGAWRELALAPGQPGLRFLLLASGVAPHQVPSLCGYSAPGVSEGLGLQKPFPPPVLQIPVPCLPLRGER